MITELLEAFVLAALRKSMSRAWPEVVVLEWEAKRRANQAKRLS